METPDRQRRRPARLLAIVALLWLHGSHAQAQATLDYDVNSAAWNGLANLHKIISRFSLEVEVVSTLDWSDNVSCDDIVIMLYPQGAFSTDAPERWARNGGTILIADDFGSSAALFRRFDATLRQDIAAQAQRYQANIPYAPVAHVKNREHPLSKDVLELVTNHPAVITSGRQGTSVFGFNNGEVVVAGSYPGEGRYVLVSDASIFINRMMQFDNLKFSENVIDYLRKPGTRRVLLAIGEFDSVGSPTKICGKRSATQTVNAWLAERNDYLLTKPATVALSILVAGAIGLVMLWIIPLRRRAKLDGSWTRANVALPAVDSYTTVMRYDQARADTNYLLPACLLRDNVNEELARLLAVHDPLHTLNEAQLLAETHHHRGALAAQTLGSLYHQLKTLPTRFQAASPWNAGYLSQRDYERLHHEVTGLMGTLRGEKS